LILLFSSPWPKRKFGETGGAVSAEYEDAVILTALSQILLFFLGSLLRFHTLVQDIVLQTLCNSGLGFMVLLMARLFAIHPALPVAVSVPLLLALLGLLGISSGKGKDELALAPPSSQEEDPTAAEPLISAALSLTPPAPLTEQQLIPSSPPSEVETPPLATVEEGEPVGSGSGSDAETNQTSAKAGEEQCMWSDDDDEEEAAEMARLRDDSSGSDESKDSDDSSGDWGDVQQVVRVTRTDSW
jgi:hypothetical protein